MEDLPTLWESYPVDGEKEYRKHNSRVIELLRDKRLDEAGVKYGERIIILKRFTPDELVGFNGQQIVQTDAVVLFWKAPAIFSQWTRAFFEVNGHLFNSAEQFMMAEKARLFGDRSTLDRIMSSNDAAEQQALGRQVAGFDHRDWEKQQYQIVVQGNLAKFSQDSARKAALLETGDRILAEASPSDRRWGIGSSADQREAYDYKSWGRNLLGQALMEVRTQLR